jgi:hypothetical protein
VYCDKTLVREREKWWGEKERTREKKIRRGETGSKRSCK